MTSETVRPRITLPVIIFSQFAGTSLWFAGNAVINELPVVNQIGEEVVGWMTSSVQLGFIAGTFLVALTTLADRYPAQKVFLLSSILGAFFNGLIIFNSESIASILSLRFATGFCLAGIYPVGMKICASWFKRGLGVSLGFLVGALVVGTSFPHLLNGLGSAFDWRQVLFSISLLSVSGGLLMYFLVPEGPFSRRSQGFKWNAIGSVFKVKEFRKAAFGYFGHMWELYAFWTYIPLILMFYMDGSNVQLNSSLGSFIVIFIGSLGCVAAGFIAIRKGSRYSAFLFLAISGLCCLLSPFAFQGNVLIFSIFMLVWGFAVVADSAQFSTLNAQNAPKDLVGTGLTIVTGIGFALTIVSIELLNFLKLYIPIQYLFLFLLPGPIAGLITIRKR